MKEPRLTACPPRLPQGSGSFPAFATHLGSLDGRKIPQGSGYLPPFATAKAKSIEGSCPQGSGYFPGFATFLFFSSSFRTLATSL